jgi:hypothetical protein
VIVIAPVRVPGAFGVKVTLIEQSLPAANEPAQVFVAAKSPLKATLEIVSVWLPVLAKVTVCGALVVPTD